MNDRPHQPLPRWRIPFLMTVMFGLWSVVIARLAVLQWWQSADLAAVARRQHHVEVEVSARPADIVDRNGRLLASTIVTPSLFVDPSRMTNASPELIKQLAGITGLDVNSLQQRLEDQAAKRFLWIKRRLTPEEAERITELDWPDGAYGFREEFLRQYPQDSLAAHVLGLRDIDGVGRGGVEQSLDHLIQGKPGRRRLVRDAMGRIVEVNFRPDDEPRRFDAVQLTIDLAVQMFVEQELGELINEWKPASVAAIVMDPVTGDVLAMASRPTYSPSALTNVPEAAWKNQAISTVYEPGSTFKPLIVAWALQQHAIKRDDIFDCMRGEYRMGNRVLHDGTHRYGLLSVSEILVKSSNIGMAQIGERLGNREMYRAAVSFGIGQPTGIELPGEVSGILRPLKDWNDYSTGSIPMGQELAVTPIQLITAHAALSNGGRLITPGILKGVQGRGEHGEADGFSTSAEDPGLAVPPRIVSRAVDGEAARWVVEHPMVAVVEEGTGRRAKLSGYTVFGKTGTAQKLDPVTGTYSESAHVSSFLCGAPANNPRVLVLVVADEPVSKTSHAGGMIAAPAAARILERTLHYLHIPPDSPKTTRTASRR